MINFKDVLVVNFIAWATIKKPSFYKIGEGIGVKAVSTPSLDPLNPRLLKPLASDDGCLVNYKPYGRGLEDVIRGFRGKHQMVHFELEFT